MKTPHKHADLIKAWADGAEIEYRTIDSPEWRRIFLNWSWDSIMIAEYRIKSEPKPDVVWYQRVTQDNYFSNINNVLFPEANLKLTFDGETGKLKAAEVIT